MPMNESTALMRSEIDSACRVFGPWQEGAVQQVETGLNLTVVLTSDGQCFQMGETGASGRVKWEGCKEPELVRLLIRSASHFPTATCSGTHVGMDFRAFLTVVCSGVSVRRSYC